MWQAIDMWINLHAQAFYLIVAGLALFLLAGLNFYWPPSHDDYPWS